MTKKSVRVTKRPWWEITPRFQPADNPDPKRTKGLGPCTTPYFRPKEFIDR
jgi:hypothetical protein